MLCHGEVFFLSHLMKFYNFCNAVVEMDRAAFPMDFYHGSSWSSLIKSGLQWMNTWPCFNIKTGFPGMGILMLKIRQSWDHHIFNIRIPTLLKDIFILRQLPGIFSYEIRLLWLKCIFPKPCCMFYVLYVWKEIFGYHLFYYSWFLNLWYSYIFPGETFSSELCPDMTSW